MAWLECIECTPPAESSLAVGARFNLDDRQNDVILGRDPYSDIVITSPQQGGRKNASLSPYGDTHILTHLKHSLPIGINGVFDTFDTVILTHGVTIQPGLGLSFRYMTDDGGLVGLREIGPYLAFDTVRPRCRRGVRRDDLNGPRYWLVNPYRRSDPSIMYAGLVGGIAAALHDVIDDDGKHWLVLDDLLGLTLAEIVAREPGAILDPAIGAHIALGIVDAVRYAPHQRTLFRTRLVHLNLDGRIVWDGHVQGYNSRLPDGEHIRQLAWLSLWLGFTDGLRRRLLRETPTTITDVDDIVAMPSDAELVLLGAPPEYMMKERAAVVVDNAAEDVVIGALYNEVRTPAKLCNAIETLALAVPGARDVTPADITALVAGLAPERAQRDEETRELLGLLDEHTLSRMVLLDR